MPLKMSRLAIAAQLAAVLSALAPFLAHADSADGESAPIGASFFLLSSGANATPGAGQAVLDYSLGLGQRTCQNCAPLSHQPSGPEGLEQSIGGRVGIGPSASLAVHGLLSTAAATTAAGVSIEGAGRLLSQEAGNPFSLIVAGGALYDAGVQHLRGRIELNRSQGRWSLSAQSLVDHGFQAGRDAMDVFVGAGASYAVTQEISAGIEYTGQDLEAIAENDAEGGTRHLVGPTLAWQSRKGPIRVLIGPAISSGPEGMGAVGRLSLSLRL